MKNKNDIIEIAEAMGFKIDYDQWSVKDKKWIRFKLNDNLDEPKLRLIWYKDSLLVENLCMASDILFKAGQKHKISQINKLESL